MPTRGMRLKFTCDDDEYEDLLKQAGKQAMEDFVRAKLGLKKLEEPKPEPHAPGHPTPPSPARGGG
jgi:hypothetical protein